VQISGRQVVSDGTVGSVVGGSVVGVGSVVGGTVVPESDGVVVAGGAGGAGCVVGIGVVVVGCGTGTVVVDPVVPGLGIGSGSGAVPGWLGTTVGDDVLVGTPTVDEG
jgi:hypothetical protein